MEMTKTKKAARFDQCGMSLIELMIASLVLTVGILACAVLIPLSIGSNFRNRQQSNSTVIAEMIMEKIMSVPASAPQTLTLSDCTGAVTNVNTAGTAAGAGASLLASGDVDFSSAAPAGYSMSYTTCGTAGGAATYDVRWNIKTISAYAKLITVSAKLRGAGTNPNMFSLPVTIRSMIGQGS